jgi:hypothetical protein
LVEEALRRIGELYRIEAEVRGRPAEERRTVRQERSKPLVEELHAWLTAQLERVLGKSSLAEAIRYALRHWPGLVLFLEDGRIELDTDALAKRFVRREPYRARVTARRRAGRGVEVPPRSLTTVAPLSRRPCALPAAAPAKPR